MDVSLLVSMNRIYVSELSKKADGDEVMLQGWVHEERELGNITFMLLRDSTGIVQITAKRGDVGEEIIKALSLPKESVVEVIGTVKKSSMARGGIEIIPKSITNLNPLSMGIPFEVTGKVPVELDVRLNNRHIDLRRAESQAIFNIQSTIMSAFRSNLRKKGFVEIRTPSIVEESTEGGSDLFKIEYFERHAYLAQSPQLYKQLAVIGGLERVFMVVPVFRAEKSNTPVHLSESTQMDIEMAFADADTVIKILSDTVLGIIKEVIKENKKDLETLKVDLKVPKIIEISYAKAISKLESHYDDIKYGSDLTKEHERKIEELFGEAVIIKNYPRALRAFYSMPVKADPALTESFDMIYKGLEISSGAQRIHNADMLHDAIKMKGMNPDNFKSYINAFRCGAPPHAGWSIGLERLTMKITGRDNIKECALFPRDRKRLVP